MIYQMYKYTKFLLIGGAFVGVSVRTLSTLDDDIFHIGRTYNPGWTSYQITAKIA